MSTGNPLLVFFSLELTKKTKKLKKHVRTAFFLEKSINQVFNSSLPNYIQKNLHSYQSFHQDAVGVCYLCLSYNL